MHNYKQGTPTAGGILFLFFISILNLISYYLSSNPIYLIVFFSSILFGFVGFIDDFLSIFKKNSLGLRSYQKLLLQIIFSLIIFYIVNKFNPHTYLKIPYIDKTLDLGFFYPIWAVLFLSGLSNSTNLSDGLDGLSSGLFIISTIMTVIVSKAPINLIYTIVLPVIAFMMFNIKPAKIFMGDTGSLALGGILASISIYYSTEIFAIFTCFVFIAEMFSVIIQVLSYKIRKKRVFLMAPVHHHFEMKGWHEERVVMNFWIINILFGILIIGG